MANITAWEKANIMCFLLEEHSSLAKKKKKKRKPNNQTRETSLVVHWLRIRLARQGVKVPSLAGNKDPTRCRATKLVCYN